MINIILIYQKYKPTLLWNRSWVTKKSKIVIGWNTTAVLEGIASNRFILIPYFHSKNIKKKIRRINIKFKKTKLRIH